MTSRERTPEAREGGRRRGLTSREREIVGLLADGMSGAQIAAKLFLSPETVRTHIRNAMAKLGASTRSQAVVLALQRHEIADAGDDETPRRRRGTSPRPPAAIVVHSAELDRALEGMLVDLCALHDVDAGLVLLAEEDGLTLRRAAVASANGALDSEIPERLALGEGPLGRVALNRRAMLLPSLSADPTGPGTALAAPILDGGRLLGVLGLKTRDSRPAGQSELLILQVLVKRVGEILIGGEDVGGRLRATVERFGASWSAATH